MINWYFIAVFLSVLHLSSSTAYKEYNIGKLNDTEYVIKEDMFSSPLKWELVMIHPDGIIQNFSLPDCDMDRLSVSFTGMKLEDNHIFLLKKNMDSGEKFLQIIDLPDLFDGFDNATCMPITDAFFGKQYIFIYEVENENVLKRWLITPDGEKVNPQTIAETDFPMKKVSVGSKYVEITMNPNGTDDFPTVQLFEDLPRCDTIENGTSCESDQEIDPISTTEYNEFYVGKLNETDYIVKNFWYSHIMQLVMMDSNGTANIFLLPNCSAEKVYMFYGNIRLQENLLIFQRWRLEKKDSFLQIVNLPDLFNGTTNETCLSVADTYFGEDKVYIYQIEEGNILKRSLITPDGGLADPQVVAETENQIEKIIVHSEGIVITTKADGNDTSTIEFHKDLPRCDTIDEDESCKEDIISEETTEIISTTEEVFVKPEAAVEGTQESNVGFKVIVICACLLILIVFAIGYFLCNSKLRSKRKQENRSKMNYDYNAVNQRPANTDGHAV